MMKLKHLILPIAAFSFLGTSSAYSQYLTDGLRLSQTDNGSTARVKAMGGAQYSIGADISTISSNPAGIGMFTSSDFSLTPGYYGSTNKSDFFGNSTSSSSNKVSLSQAGGVIYMPTARYTGQNTTSGLLSVNFGLNFNTTNLFNNGFQFSGKNTGSSVTQFFSDLANQSGASSVSGLSAADPLAYAAYQNYLIDLNESTGTWVNAAGPGSIQNNSDFQKGFQNEVNAALGLNFSNTFYIGGSIGLSSFEITKDRQFNEQGTDRFSKTYNATFAEYTHTRGSGINGRLGVIYRPINNFRFGLTYQTPTWYSVEDYYEQHLTNANSTTSGSIAPYSSELNITTPGKVTGSVTLLDSRYGLITADVDFVNYKGLKVDDGSSNYSGDNSLIEKTYRSAVNFRVGAEGRVTDNISLRAGYSKDGSPYSNSAVKDFGRQNISGGVGYRKNNIYADIAYVNSSYNFNHYSAYSYPDVSNQLVDVTSNIKHTSNNVLLTVGIKF